MFATKPKKTFVENARKVLVERLDSQILEKRR